MPREIDPQPGVGLAVRKIRTRQRMTQVDLSKRCGLHPTWISHIEAGRKNLNYGTVRRLAYGLNVTLQYLAWLSLELEDAITAKPKKLRRVRRNQIGKAARKKKGRGRRRCVVSINRARRRPPTQPSDPTARLWGSRRQHSA